MLRYPASSAVDTTCSVSRGATWKVPKPSWGICTLLFKVMVDTSFILAATHAHRESVPRRMYQPDADRALRGVCNPPVARKQTTMDVELSDLPVTSYVFEYAQRWPDQPALIDGLTGVAISYQELIGAVRRAAAGFVAHGMAKGDVMALCSPNRPEFVITYYAALAAGGVVTTVNPMATAAELAGQLRSSGARWMVTTPELFERKVSAAAAAADTAAAQLREVFVFGSCTGAAPFAALLNDAPPAPTTEIGADHLAVLLYSSGTTGLPKAVMLSHRNLVASLCQTRLVQLVRPGDVVIAA